MGNLTGQVKALGIDRGHLAADWLPFLVLFIPKSIGNLCARLKAPGVLNPQDNPLVEG